MRVPLCVLGNALLLADCASPYVEVSHVHPQLTGTPASGPLAAAEQAMTKVWREEHAMDCRPGRPLRANIAQALLEGRRAIRS